jgi:chromosome segregation ATPase
LKKTNAGKGTKARKIAMAGLGLQDDSQSADGQLQLGLQLIQQSYNRRVEELTREVEHWKRVAQHHKQQEAQTREELGKANQRGSELQRQLGEKNQEVAQLTEARNVALNQIATLKKHASQLQSFKKNISNMLQVSACQCLRQSIRQSSSIE